ncbi:MAG TPA: hypothetical protein VFU47_02020 [Armatimonadota bacterium]|nr:hypothetical protein [Armatimonadota bacterium]
MMGVMVGKDRSNRKVYVEALRRMTPEQRLQKALELSSLVRRLTLHGLRERFPEAREEELHRLFLKRLEQCRNRRYRSRSRRPCSSSRSRIWSRVTDPVSRQHPVTGTRRMTSQGEDG